MALVSTKLVSITLPHWAVDALTEICAANATTRSGQILRYIVEDSRRTSGPPAGPKKKR
jgi:hypothetical protein